MIAGSFVGLSAVVVGFIFEFASKWYVFIFRDIIRQSGQFAPLPPTSSMFQQTNSERSFDAYRRRFCRFNFDFAHKKFIETFEIFVRSLFRRWSVRPFASWLARLFCVVIVFHSAFLSCLQNENKQKFHSNNNNNKNSLISALYYYYC